MRKVLRFHRFARTGYAAFRTMHRVVNIGRLVSYISDRQLHKSAVPLMLFVPLLCSSVMAQSDDELPVNLLPALDVVAVSDTLQGSSDAVAVITRHQLQGLPVSSVGELLKQLPGLDLRTRGGNDVQGDLTIRGGTFDQMIILLNGVNLNDAQTGHHNLDIPIDLSMVDRVEIIPAAALSHYGLSSFCGAVNIVTGEMSSNSARLLLSGGSFGQAHLSAGANKTIGKWSISSAVGYHRSNGYMDNTDFDHGSVYIQARRHGEKGSWSLQLGGQFKDFGSQAFYSVKYPDQYEETRTVMGAVSHTRLYKGWQLEATAYGRMHKDRFELFREGVVEAPAWYTGHNYHFSTNLGFRYRASHVWSLGKSTVGCEVREEGILSTVLGDSLKEVRPIILEPDNRVYTLGKTRLGTNLFAEHGMMLGRVKVALGLLGSYNSLQGLNHGLSLSADYPLAKSWDLSGSMGRSFRLPTYNDLYYHSATQISNPNLLSEKSYHAELNVRYKRPHFVSVATIYGRHGANIIDWVRHPDSSVWHCVNHSVIDAMGTEINSYYHSDGFVRRIGVSYSFCALAQQADGFISNYVLDYLKHKLTFDLVLSPLKGLRVKLLTDYHQREGSYTDANGSILDYEPVLLLNGGIEYGLGKSVFFIEGYNLLNKQYCDYGGIPQPGASVIGGFRFNL